MNAVSHASAVTVFQLSQSTRTVEADSGGGARAVAAHRNTEDLSLMSRLQIILTVTIVALAAAAIWAWQSGSQQSAEPQVASAAPSAAVRPPALPTPGEAATRDPIPAPSSEPQAASVPAAPDVDQAATNVPVEPTNVDTPEPAQQKFARGGRADPEQN